MKTRKSATIMTQATLVACSVPLLMLVIALSPVNGTKAAAVASLKFSTQNSSRSLPKRQTPNQNVHAQAAPYPYTSNHNYNEHSRDTQHGFQRRADVGSDNKRFTDNNNYQPKRYLGGNENVSVRNAGDKRNSQDSYDPFYFYQPQSNSNGPKQYQQLYQRQRGDLAINSNPPRNRRNSHNSGPYNNNHYLDSEKYNILTKSAYPLDNNFANANSYQTPYNSRDYDRSHNTNQFLSQDQLTRQGTNRHFPPSNSLDYYGAQSYRGRGDVPWSVQIGTQLKVNDDGRAPNPTQFYVRDERNGPSNRRRPIYRK